MSPKKFKFESETEKEIRLDKFLLAEFQKDKKLQDWTRSQIKNLIEGGAVSYEGKALTKAGYVINRGNEIEIKSLNFEKEEFEPWDKLIPVIFEDKHLIVVDKPAGVTMHPGAGKKSQTLVHALSSHFSKDLLEKDSRAGVVHRLDKDTSGIVVLAKNVQVHADLSEMFAKREIKKTYIALALSTPRSKRAINKEDSGQIETFINRDAKSRIKMSVSSEAGRNSITNWKVKERMHYACLMEIDLMTGRTHQIRVHFDHINSPIIGDRTYGNFSSLPPKLKKTAEEFGRQALHAECLKFKHPVSKKVLDLHAPLPKDMLDLIDEFRKFNS